jgi:hypothetical protein
MRAELGGEAAARADFRRIMLGAGSGAWSPDDSGDERTLILPVEAAGISPRPLQGRHRRQRPARRGKWQAKALVGVAAAAVVVVGVSALTGTFSGSGSQPAQSGTSPSATNATSPSTASGSKGVEGSASATREPTHSSSPTASQQSGDGTDTTPSELCREYYAPQEPLGKQDAIARFHQLSDLAGGPMNVYSYCLRFLEPWDAGSTDQGNQGPHRMNGLPGHDGNGKGNGNGNGNGKGNQGKDGAGSDGQNQQ